MTVEQGLVAELLAASGVTDIVGTKVHPGKIPQGLDSPAVVYNRVSSPRELALDGTAASVAVRLRLDCWHTSQSGAWSLAAAVRAALNSVGVGGNVTLGAEPVHAVYLENESTLGDFDGDELDYRVTQDWIVEITEA